MNFWAILNVERCQCLVLATALQTKEVLSVGHLLVSNLLASNKMRSWSDGGLDCILVKLYQFSRLSSVLLIGANTDMSEWERKMNSMTKWLMSVVIMIISCAVALSPCLVLSQLTLSCPVTRFSSLQV